MRKSLAAVLFIIVLLFIGFRVDAQELPSLVVVQRAAALDIANVDFQDLEELDNYIREVEGDIYSQPHILVVVPDSTFFNEVSGLPHNFTGWTGATLGVNWNFVINNRGEAFVDPPVRLSIVTLFQNDATQLGLIAHELSHAVFTDHGDGQSLGDANFWERITNAAYNRNCGISVYCLDIEDIIYGD